MNDRRRPPHGTGGDDPRYGGWYDPRYRDADPRGRRPHGQGYGDGRGGGYDDGPGRGRPDRYGRSDGWDPDHTAIIPPGQHPPPGARPYGTAPYGQQGYGTAPYGPQYRPGPDPRHDPRGYRYGRGGPYPDPGRRYPVRDRRQGRVGGRVVLGRILATLVSAALLLVTGAAWATLTGPMRNATDSVTEAGEAGVAAATHGMNILVVGSDARTDADGNPLSAEELAAVNSQAFDGVNTDTIMILHVPADGGPTTAVSIPRDTWISGDITAQVDGPYDDGSSGPYRANKINSFYSSAKTYTAQHLVATGETDRPTIERKSNEAGRTMLIRIIQHFTGLRIDHYAEINLIGFYLLSEAIGGVPVCLLAPVRDYRSGANFPAGEFEVSGSDALAFVRQRHGLPRGDLDRIRRQQVFLASAAGKMLSAEVLTSPSRLKSLVDTADRSLVLDSGFDLLDFAEQMLDLSEGDIVFDTIPTHGAVPGIGTYALATDPVEIAAFFSELAAPEGSQPDPTIDISQVIVDVQNGTQIPGLAASVGQQMADAGFVRGQLSDYPGTTDENQQPMTMVRYPSGDEVLAEQVRGVIGLGSLVVDDEVPAGHILVVAGLDLPAPAGLRGSGEALLPAAAPPAASAAGGWARDTAPAGDSEEAINASSVPCIN